MCRFMDTSESAWSIVDAILRIGPMELHLIQRDLTISSKMLTGRLPVKRRRGLSFLFALFKKKQKQLGGSQIDHPFVPAHPPPSECLKHRSFH
jgi:hypothetical protein